MPQNTLPALRALLSRRRSSARDGMYVAPAFRAIAGAAASPPARRHRACCHAPRLLGYSSAAATPAQDRGIATDTRSIKRPS